MWGDGGKASKKEKETLRNQKVAESQKALIEAAISTADMAAAVTKIMRNNMEDAIKQFESTAKIMHEGLLICDLDGCVKAFNGAAESMFGLAGEAAVAMLFEFSGRPLINTDELYDVVKSKKRTLIGRHVDGTLFPVSARMSVLERADGSSVVLLATQDMTAVTKTLGSPFDASAVALANGEIVAANPGVKRLFGYTPEEIIGKNVSTIMKSIDRHGIRINIQFEVARMTWMGDDAVLITMREVGDKKTPKMKRDNGVDMICTYDPDFKITSANTTFLKHYSIKKKDAIEADIREYMPYDEVNEFTENVRALTSKNSYYRSNYAETISDTKIIHDWVDHAIFNTAGELSEVQRTGRDIGQALAKLLPPNL
jgi:PAS domain-containing protein